MLDNIRTVIAEYISNNNIANTTFILRATVEDGWVRVNLVN